MPEVDSPLGVMEGEDLTKEAFMHKMLEAYPLSEVSEDEEGQLIIHTGWYQDPDEPDYIYYRP